MVKVKLGSLEKPFFYIVLDNCKQLFKIERQKKILEKLSICQANLVPQVFSIVLINDCMMPFDSFPHEGTNIFSEFHYSVFHFEPMQRAQIERLMLDMLREMYTTDENLPNYGIDSHYLETVFPDFFSLLYQMVSTFTVTVNEYAYLCNFLYPYYMELVYTTHKQLLTCLNDEVR